MSGLATVAIVYSLGECAVVLSRLQAYGIHAMADPWHTASVAWHWTVALGGIRIVVFEGDLEVAAELLADREPDEQPMRLPFSRYPLLNALVAIAILLAASVPPPARIPGSYYVGSAGPKRPER